MPHSAAVSVALRHFFSAPPYPSRQPCAHPSPSRMRRCERRRKRERTESKENVAVTLSNENEVIEKVAVPTIRTKVVTEQVAHVLTEKHAESFGNLKVHQVSAEEAVCSAVEPPEQEEEHAELIDEKDMEENKNNMALDSITTNDIIQVLEDFKNDFSVGLRESIRDAFKPP